MYFFNCEHACRCFAKDVYVWFQEQNVPKQECLLAFDSYLNKGFGNLSGAYNQPLVNVRQTYFTLVNDSFKLLSWTIITKIWIKYLKTLTWFVCIGKVSCRKLEKRCNSETYKTVKNTHTQLQHEHLFYEEIYRHCKDNRKITREDISEWGWWTWQVKGDPQNGKFRADTAIMYLTLPVQFYPETWQFLKKKG